MSPDDTDGTTRRNVLEKGALLGSALAMGAIGGAAGDTGGEDTSASVGALQGTVYQWSSGPDANGYAGPNSGRSNVSPNTGDVYIGWDSGAETLWRGDGSSWVQIADFSNIGSGGSGSFEEESFPYDAVVYFDSSASEYVYFDMRGRSGSVGEVSRDASSPAPLLNSAIADYDGAADGTRSGSILLGQMSADFSETVTTGQGTRIVGLRHALYSRDPSSAAGGEFLTHIETGGAADPLFELTDSAAPNGNAKGSGIYGVDMTGGGRGSDTTTFVEMGTAGRTTVENCVLWNTGGDGVFCNDSFSAHVIRTQIRDCGLYSEDGSGNENGTNGIRTAVTDQNVNLTFSGFVIQGPGAGVTSPSSDIPSAIRSESGASVKVIEQGGTRSGVKVHSGAATAAGIKGEDLILRDLIITGEGSAAAAVHMKGGRLVATGGEWEKMRDIVLMENNFTGGVSKIEGVYFDSPDASGTGDGNAVRVPSGGSGGVPALDDCTFINIDRSAVRIEDGTGSARLTGGAIADVATSGTGYVIEDNRSSPSQRHHIIGTDTDTAPNGIINDWSLMGTYMASEGNAAPPFLSLPTDPVDLSTLTASERVAGQYYEANGTNLPAGLARYDGTAFTSLIDGTTYTP